MSLLGQHVSGSGVVVRSMALRLSHGASFATHAHAWGQFIYAAHGALAVESDARRWVVPPQRGVWVPSGVAHTVESIGETWMRTVYLHPDIAGRLSDACRVLAVSPLLREVIAEITRVGMLDPRRDFELSMAGVLIAKLGVAPTIDASLVLPRDRRALRVARRIISDPATEAPLASLARGVGASARTINRIFVRETHMTFGRWRQHARLLHAIRLLSEGNPVLTTAFDCGYRSPSAFVAMFKRCTGMTPARFVRTD